MTDLNEGWPVISVAFSPDGKRIASDLGNDVRLSDAETGKPLATLKGHTFWGMYAIAFSSDGKRIVSADRNNTARLWDGNTGESIAVLKGHENWLSYAEFSPDNRYIVTSSNDGTARLWDAATGQSLAILEGHQKSVSKAIFSPDGKYIATISGDHTARLWRIFPEFEGLRAQAIKHLGQRRLSCEQREEFFPDKVVRCEAATNPWKIESEYRMIKSFKHKGLERFYQTGNTSGIQAAHRNRLRLILSNLDQGGIPIGHGVARASIA